MALTTKSNHGLPDRRFDEKGYQDTIEYWKTKIQKRCEKEHKLCVTREELSDMECSRYLQEVLDELVRAGKVRTVRSIFPITPSWGAWVFSVATFWWPKSANGKDPLQREYVFVDYANEVATRVIERATEDLPDGQVNWMPLGQLIKEEKLKSEKDGRILVALCAEKQLGCMFTYNNKPYVLFGPNCLSPTAQVIVGQKITIDSLEKRIAALAQQSQKAKVQAMQLQRQNKKKEALMIYRVYKCSESKANELRGQVVNLEQIVERIESHPLEVQVYGAYKQSAKTLEEQKAELNPDKVADVMDNVHDSLDDAKEVQDALSRDLSPVDAQELQKELDALDEKDAEEKGAAAQQEKIDEKERKQRAEDDDIILKRLMDALPDVPPSSSHQQPVQLTNSSSTHPQTVPTDQRQLTTPIRVRASSDPQRPSAAQRVAANPKAQNVLPSHAVSPPQRVSPRLSQRVSPPQAGLEHSSPQLRKHQRALDGLSPEVPAKRQSGRVLEAQPMLS